MLEWFSENFSWILDIISNILSTINSTIGIIVTISGVITIILSQKIRIDHQTKQSMKYYVPARGFNIDPCDQENIDSESGFGLIPFFLKAFKDSESQYFIILADSGMGKTSFLLKLYKKYKRKLFKKHHIFFYALSDSDTLENIKKIKRKRKTILLLDSFDEASKAMDDYENYMQTLCNETKLFYKIVMTCRTQFFPNSDKEPKVTGNIKVGVGKKNIEFEKYYILPFNNSEIETYLKKKYNHFFEKKKFERAHELVLRCPKLMVRPMLLSYIDYLIDDWKVEYNTVYEIYDKLVSKWIEREALYTNNLLHVFSEKVAEHMYHNNTVHIEENDIMKLCKEYNIDLRSIEAKSRSLLNRNANGLYKFAHTSFLEFFLSKKAFKEEEFRKRIISNGFIGYDMLKLFIKEKSLVYLHDLLQDNSMELKSKVLKYLILSKVDFSGISIIDCDFEGCVFTETNFANSNFYHVNFRKCEFRDTYFENTILEGVDLTEADLTGADLYRLNLSNTNFQSAKLVFADLSNSILVNSNLTQADLRGTKLNASIWDESDIRKSLSQLKVADFTYLMIRENNELKRVERKEVFLNKD